MSESEAHVDVLGEVQGVRMQSIVAGVSKPNEGTPRRNVLAKNGLYQDDVTTMHEMFEETLKTRTAARCFGKRVQDKDGKWGDFHFETYDEIATRRHKKGDFIGIYSINRTEWVVTDLACNAYSWPCISLYDTLGKDAVQYIVNHAEIKLAVCAGKQLSVLLSTCGECPTLKTLICMDAVSDEQQAQAKELGVNVYTFAEIEEKGKANPVEFRPPQPSDLYTVMYTSGTTGNPKGVMLTHANFIAELTGVRYHFDGLESGFSEKDVHLSYLPLAHSFERAVMYTCLSFGACVGFFRGIIPELFDDIASLKPTFLVGAPRVWTRLHDKVQAGMTQAGGLKQFVFETAFNWKRDADAKGESTPLLDSLVFSKSKERLGGNVKWIMSGSAPLDPKLAQWLKLVFCCQVVEGYGLTENCAGAFVTELTETKLGHVGKPFVCTECKLVDIPDMKYTSFTTKENPLPTGEVCLRGGNVFQGYYKEDDKTKECMDDDGWFHTGDVGRWNINGTLSIIDRKKNIFKLAQGEYVAVEYLEGVYQRSQFVGQVWVYGNSFKPFLVAVVVPDFDVLVQHAAQNLSVKGSNEELCANEKVIKLVFDDMVAQAKEAKLHGFEFVKAVHLFPDMFSVDNDLTTPTFKLKRPQLLAKFKEAVDAMYQKLGE